MTIEQESKVDLEQALRVFQKVITHGEKHGDDYHLNGVIANTGFDGYRVTLRDDSVTLNIDFHSRFSMEYDQLRDEAVFLNKLALIDEAEF